MEIYFALALGGLPIGAMYALSAMGIVIIYKTSRVFNFASGAVGLVCAYLASSLADSMPVLLAVAIASGVGVALGLLMALSVRPVRGALPKTIVTLGWLLLLQGVIGLFYGTQVATREPARMLSSTTLIHVGILQWGRDQAGVLLISAALAMGLAVFFKRSGLGIATRAVAEGPSSAQLLGIRVGHVQLVAWGIGGGISGLAGVLVSPLLNKLDTTTLIVFTVQALAAALVGRLSSLPLTLVGGLALGVAQPVVRYALRDMTSLQGTDELTALLVVLVALVLLRRGSGRSDVSSSGLDPVPVRALPSGRAAFASILGIAIAGVLLPLLVDDIGVLSRYNLTVIAVWAMAVLSLVLLVGVVGEVSVCQAVFMGVGAFGVGIGTDHGLPFLLALLVGAAMAALLAVLVGLPAIRLQPLELAIATLSLAFTADRFLYSFKPLVSGAGTRQVPRPSFAAVDGTQVASGERAYAWLAIGLFIAAGFAVANLRRARTGAALTALRSSQPATAAMGFSVVSVKLSGFAASGFLAGLAGALYAGLVQGASGAPFDFTRSITLLAFAVIVGVGSVPGALVGGMIVMLSTYSGSGGDVADGRRVSITTAITGLVLIGILQLAPEGGAGVVQRLRLRLRAIRRSAPTEALAS